MISFRYHVVSLVAAFLALAVGIIAGSTVVDQKLIEALQGQRNRDQDIKEDLRDQNETLRAEVLLWEGFGDELLLPALEGRLNGVDATIILPPFTPDAFRVDLRSTLNAAGARVDGEVRLGSRLVLEDSTAAEQLALAIEAGSRRGDDLLRAAGTWIGGRIGEGMLDGIDGGPLTSADFVSIGERRAGSAAKHVTVVAWDATQENENLVGTLMESLVAAAADTDEAVVVAEALAQEPSLVTRTRDANALRRSVSTVDHAGTTLGSVALAAAVADLLSDPATIRHYGVLGGATAALPEGAFQAVAAKSDSRPVSKTTPKPTATATASS